MPENEFEKKVSSEMQELKFAPSEKVWLRVEERIRKKNKRRVFVIIFLLAGLALLGYWQRDNLFGERNTDIVKTEKQKEDNPKTPAESDNPSTIKQNAETPKQEETQNTADRAVIDKLKKDRSVIDKRDIADSKNEINKPKDKKTGELNVKPASEKTKIKDAPAVSNVISPNSQKKDILTGDETKDTLVVKTNLDTIVKQDEVEQPEVKPLEHKIDSAKSQVIEKTVIPAENSDTVLKTVTKESANPIVKKDSSVKKWKWGLHLTPGISSLNDHTISFGALKSADAYNYQNQVGSGSSAAPPRQRPSDIKPGFAFQAGIFAQRQLSSRISLSFGLQYGYYSNVIRIGNRRDSLLNNSQFSSLLDGNQDRIYNAGGDTIKYTNRYHFIELPFRFQWQLNKNNSKPIVWSTGFTAGQLIASNAMMYDTAFNGIYYRNKKQANKTQFSLSTGFSWTLANNRRAQWNLGPVATIHLNRLIENPFENKKYLFFAGVRSSILFKPKK